MMAVLSNIGFKRPTYAEILDAQIARAKTLFGDDIETSELTILGKYIRLNVYDIAKLYEELENVYYARFPMTATGESLDRLCVFAGITRNPATASQHILKITGEAGATIDAGDLIVGTDDNITFYLANDLMLESKTDDDGVEYGEGDGLFICTEAGTIGNVGIGTINKIMQPNLYVKEIEHISIKELGTEIETDVALRARFVLTVGGIGSGTIDSLYSALWRVAGVTGVYIVENDTDATVSNRQAKSVECYILGGTDNDIANAIFSKMPVGIATVSTADSTYKRVVEVTDTGGTVHNINFSRTKEKMIYIKISVAINTHFEESGVDDIKNSIITHLANLTNGDDVIYSSLYSDVHSVAGVVSSVITLSEDGKSYSAADIVCKGSEVARTNVNCIDIEVANYADR